MTPRQDRARALETVRDLVRLDSRTETPGESAASYWVADRMRELGLETELLEVGPGRYDAIGIWRGTGGGRSLMFNGHLDTNPLTEGWTVDPWGAEVRDGCVYGLGVSNMKAGCASYLEAVRTLMSAGYRPAGDVILTFVVGELQEGVGTRALIDAGYRADAFVNCEPTDLSALTVHAGAATFTIELRGDTRHLSKREESGDALAAAAALVPRINAMTFAGALDDDAAHTNRAHVGVLRAGLSEELIETRPPQVADVARLAGSLRYGPGQTASSALGELSGLVEEVLGAHPRVTASVAIPPRDGPTMDAPFHAEPGSRVVAAVNAAYEAVRGEPQPTGAIRPYCFYGSDASLLQHMAGMPGIVCGPGGKYNTMPDERVELRDYHDMIDIHTRTIQALCT